MFLEHENLLRESLRGTVNLFLGAGFSTLARDKHGNTLPIGGQLAVDLRARFNLKHLDQLPLPQLCTIIARTCPEELHDYLVERLTVVDFDPAYRVLDQLDASAIFTLNIDNLLHKVFEASTERYLNDVDQSGPVYNRHNAIDLFMLHGSVLSATRPLRFSAPDVASSFHADPDRWYTLQTRIRMHPTLFWGCSLADAPVLEALLPHTSRTTATTDAWIVVHPSLAETPGVLDYFRALNLHIIIGDTSDVLGLIHSCLAHRAAPISIVAGATKDLFPSAAVPALGSVPSRPIIDFFKGAAPMWCDIYSGVLHRTSYYNTIRESIYSGRHTIVTGIPGSGKTTLLMQLAAHMPFEGHKLIYTDLNKAQAELVVRRLGAAPALVFLDNLTSDTAAFLALFGPSNIRVVGADRDYSLSAVAHLVHTEKCKVINVTDLSEQELQACRQSIPEAIRKPRYQHPEVTPGVQPSLFEFVQANITEPTLRRRFEEALRALRTTTPALAEMLLFVSYVHTCRTPVSMDMAIAYWRDSIADFNQIYRLVNQAGALITDYEGDLAEEPQDYFAARSLLVAESIIAVADAPSLHGMLVQFHKNISRLRICHYDSFKRHAYDHKLIGRAFADWKDGSEFYDMIYRRDPNPYTRQHQALFLSGKGCHAEAFRAIDLALAESRTRNWSIGNSHAIILFRANIGYAADPEARKTLDRSMTILGDCYRSDRRKAFHAMTFADFALKYDDAYRDAKAHSYIEQACEWLRDERVREPWLDGIEQLTRVVERRLR